MTTSQFSSPLSLSLSSPAAKGSKEEEEEEKTPTTKAAVLKSPKKVAAALAFPLFYHLRNTFIKCNVGFYHLDVLKICLANPSQPHFFWQCGRGGGGGGRNRQCIFTAAARAINSPLFFLWADRVIRQWIGRADEEQKKRRRSRVFVSLFSTSRQQVGI